MKKMMLLVSTILLIVAFTGCGNPGKPAQPETTSGAAVEGAPAAVSKYAGSTLNIYNWSYYISQDVIDAFQEKFGVKVVYDIFDSNEQMFAKLKAGATGYDITFPSGDYVSIMIKEGMVEKLDKSKITNFKNIDPMVFTKITYDQSNEYSIPYMMGGTGIAVNKKFVKDYKKDNSIFERADLKGKITLLDDMREVMGHALKTLGYSVNTTNKDELEKAKQLVLKWKKNILRFDSESFAKLFAQGEVWVVQGYAENIFKELDEKTKAEVEFFIPPYGGPMYIDSMVILKDSKNKELAYEFINFIHEPEQYAKIIDFLGYPSINTAANTFIKNKPNYELSALKECELKEDLGENLELYNKIWEDIRIKNQ